MLNNWLSPLKRRQFSNFEHLSEDQFGKRIVIYTEGALPDLSDIRLAIVGVGSRSANAVRKALYKLHFPFEDLKICDLGNARKKYRRRARLDMLLHAQRLNKTN